VLRPALLLALLLAGCDAVQVRDAHVTDDELQADGEWTGRDALARALLDHEAPPEQAGAWPTRLAPAHRKLVTEVRVGETTIYVPRITYLPPFAVSVGALEALLGLDYERRYQFITKDGANGVVLVNRDRAPTVIAIDPDRPLLPRRETPARAFDAVERAIERDVERVLGVETIAP
jgi:hypothetical protein